MKKFISTIFQFLLFFLLIVMLGLFLPTTPRAGKSLLMAIVKKDSLLKHVSSPRIIFVGGSNISFSLNSKIIKDSLKINPINTGIHASLGLKFMLDNTLKNIKNGDIVILIPEYVHFYRDLNYGTEELLRITFDANRSNFSIYNRKQIINILPYLIKYALSKFNIIEYMNLYSSEIYSVNSFNEFGDACAHWNMKKQYFMPYGEIDNSFNYEIINEIIKFNKAIEDKKGKLFLSFPAYQDISFQLSKKQIKRIEDELKETNIKIIGTPERYMINDSLIFNSPYHLVKLGVDYRTKLFVEDFKKISSEN